MYLLIKIRKGVVRVYTILIHVCTHEVTYWCMEFCTELIIVGMIEANNSIDFVFNSCCCTCVHACRESCIYVPLLSFSTCTGSMHARLPAVES